MNDSKIMLQKNIRGKFVAIHGNYFTLRTVTSGSRYAVGRTPRIHYSSFFFFLSNTKPPMIMAMTTASEKTYLNIP